MTEDQTPPPTSPDTAEKATPAQVRQTLGHLRSLFEKHGISPRRQLGQNFLIDLNLHDVILREAGITQRDVILEVGTGTGALTERMADMAGAVVAVELDPAMGRLTCEVTKDKTNVTLLRQDVLKNKNRIASEVLDTLDTILASVPGRRLKLVANLPYAIATPLVTNLLLDDAHCPILFVAMVQWEMAERLVAEPLNSEYSSLSVLVTALADVEILRRLPPAVFWPRPKVDSAIVRIVPNPDKRAAISDLPWFAHVVRQIFLHRRKNLRVVLHSMFHHDKCWTKPVVDELLAALDLPTEVRAEALNVEEFEELATALKQKLGALGIEAVTPDRLKKNRPSIPDADDIDSDA
ncbi:MAG: 16S rRNA (adenine(1518)-N(6)/adenine(1519)-N(6))-dimethyltransferase RsmA [bacterium]